ncbi:hypothetical protein [Methylocystis echinoides]|uniref:Sulfur globule protein n=1 Tax=Methylocystis echinoides TaxID=29468 RepID=A0A9W6LTH7_9HYPH|nr:hypothetical protein [Methylocystis echinoides]GLI94506.1 hypothetical protein LMG27198_34980 [Methylocystis echinoides]
MSLKRIKTIALATAVLASAGIGMAGSADAHVYRHYGWHSGWHVGWHRHAHWRHYGFARHAVYGYAAPAAVYGSAGCGCPSATYGYAAPAVYGGGGCCAGDYYGYGGGLFGLGFPGGGLLGLGLGPL